MTPAPRLVACDLDGTLQHEKQGITPRTRDALARARAAGARVVIITGRPTHRVTWLGDLGVELCCDNGASRYDLATGAITVTAPIPATESRAVLALLRAELPGVIFAVERADGHHWGLVHEPGWVPHPSPVPGLETTVLDAHLDGAIAKLALRHPDIHADELVTHVDALLAGRLEPTHGGASLPGEVEMTRARITKGTTLQAVAARYGIPARDTVAFGDSHNDVSMLAWAGRSYAMADGHPAALAAATALAPSAAEDGVAVILEQLYG